MLSRLTIIISTTILACLPAQSAFAAESAAPNAMGQIAMLAFFLGIFYLLIWRPQHKKAKAHRSLVSNLSVGDEVATTGGLIGKITKIGDAFLAVEVTKGMIITLQRQAITAALPKGTMANS
ncbi:MAG: preprotein translocase subunit YajC [Thiotrichales bacterium]|nr:MAG: preprotein translocase subunit YajC [Thiotrichales bacterium]